MTEIRNIKVTVEEKNLIINNGADKLPLNPTSQGFSGQSVRKQLAQAVTGARGSVLALMIEKFSIIEDFSNTVLLVEVKVIGDDLTFVYADGREFKFPLDVITNGLVKFVNDKAPDENGRVVINIDDISELRDFITSTTAELFRIDFEFTKHKNDTDNPHNVTAEQINTYEKGVINSKIGAKLDNVWTDLTNQTTSFLTDEFVLNRGNSVYKTTLATMLSNVAGTEIFVVFQELPEIGQINKIYLVPKTTPEGQNAYDEFIWTFNEDTEDYGWERIGSVSVDLESYARIDVKNTFTQPQGVPNAENDDEAVNLGQLNDEIDALENKYGERSAFVQYQSNSGWAKIAQIRLPSDNSQRESITFLVTTEDNTSTVAERYTGILELNTHENPTSSSLRWLVVSGFGLSNFNLRVNGDKLEVWVLPTVGTMSFAVLSETMSGENVRFIELFDVSEPATRTGTSLGNSEKLTIMTNAEIKVAYESNTDTNAFTDSEKTKLGGIEAGAQVNVKPDWNASPGNEAEILNKPTIDQLLGFTPENQANKKTTLTDNDVDFPTTKAVKTAIDTAISQTLKPMGNWDAFTNTPELTDNDISKANQVYYVDVVGTQFGIAFDIGDELVYNTNGVIFKRDNVDAVISINGKEGVVTLTQDDITDGSTYKRVTNTEKTTWNNKVDKIAGKGLSTEDYTSAEKNKLSGVQVGAQVNKQPDEETITLNANDELEATNIAIWRY